jgi:hypothetical protein
MGFRESTGQSFLFSWTRDLNYRQGKAQPQFVFEINLDVVHPVLLKLHAAKIMDIGRVPFHFFQHELDFGLRNYLLFVNAHDPRSLPKFSRPATPTRPDAYPHTIYRQRRRGNDVEHTHERLHSIEFAAHIFADNGALQIGKNKVRFHHQLIRSFRAPAVSIFRSRARFGKEQTGQILVPAPNA